MMSLQDIRLRLVIRRHAVPEVKLIWPCSVTEDLTIAKLLTQINEAIPLESGEWGLEDYAVELADGKGGSYECLHFQPVGRTLKDEDQVIIRSLLSEDLKRRRLSGRHQISNDGKHLVDGLAFGRPWLRTPRDRPAIELPPRKRARITYGSEEEEDEEDEDDEDYSGDDEDDEEEDEGEEEEPVQLMLEGPDPKSVSVEAMFNNADSDEDDDEFAPDEESEDEGSVIHHTLPGDGENANKTFDEDAEVEDMAAELQLLQRDNATIDHEPPLETLEFDHGASSDNETPGAVNLDLTALDNIFALRQAFPLTSVLAIEKALRKKRNDLKLAYAELSNSNSPSISFDEVLDRIFTGLLDPQAQQPLSLESERDAGARQAGKPARPLIEEVETIEEPAPNGISDVTTGTLNISPPPNRAKIVNLDEPSSSSSSSSNSSSSEPSSSDDDNSSDEEGERDASAASPVASPAANGPASEASSDSDTSSSDDDDDEDGAPIAEPEHDSNPDSTAFVKEYFSIGSGKAGGDSSSSESSSSESSDDSESEPEQLPSKRRSQTKTYASELPTPESSSQLKKESRPSTLAPQGQLSQSAPGSGLSRTQKRNARRRQAKQMQHQNDGQPFPAIVNQLDSVALELAARKKALLHAIGQEAPNATQEKSIAVAEAPVEAAADPKDTPTIEKPQTGESASKSESSQRRTRIDLGAGRRLLFGALGLQNPKTKTDEEKLRQGLMKNVRPLQNPRTAETSSDAIASGDKPTDEVDEDFESWKENITYQAIECCHHGMVLSEPPFPFVQRWDPRQQFGTMRKRKRSSNHYNDRVAFEEDSQLYEEAEPETDSSRTKPRKRKSKDAQNQPDETIAENEDNITLNYDDIPAKTHGAASSQITDMDDLPALPSDSSTLPALKAGQVKTGMVITWKQWLLSKATKWQPEIAPVTGLVLSGSDETTVHVVLAKRDREPNDKIYDENTGKRIYDKFEAPDSDEEDLGDDDGHRTVPWTDMMEPRLVQREPSATSKDKDAEPANGESVSQSEQPETQVSESCNNDESALDDQDTQQIRAAIEQDLNTRPNQASNESISIQSGQGQPMVDLPTLGNEMPMSTSEGPSMNQEAVSGSREGTAFLDALHLSAISDQYDNLHQEKEETVADGPAVLDIAATDAMDAAPMCAAAPESASVVSENSPSLNTPSLDLEHRAKGDGAPTAGYPHLTVTLSPGSIRSGRQPHENYIVNESIEHPVDDCGSMIPDTVPRPGEPTLTPTDNDNPTFSNKAVTSSPPFPSLEQIYHTARQTQSQGRSSQLSGFTSIKPRIRRDLGYEDEMRKLDEGEDSDGSPNKIASIRSLFPNVTRPAAEADAPELELGSTPKQNRARANKRRAKKQLSPFAVPEGSQVITLSSSPSPSLGALVEDYADDDEDETYAEKSNMPKGPGWVDKGDGRGRASKKATRRNTKRVSSATQARITRSSGSSRSQEPTSNRRASTVDNRATRSFTIGR